jgi:hypothetical protein
MMNRKGQRVQLFCTRAVTKPMVISAEHHARAVHIRRVSESTNLVQTLRLITDIFVAGQMPFVVVGGLAV